MWRWAIPAAAAVRHSRISGSLAHASRSTAAGKSAERRRRAAGRCRAIVSLGHSESA